MLKFEERRSPEGFYHYRIKRNDGYFIGDIGWDKTLKEYFLDCDDGVAYPSLRELKLIVKFMENLKVQ